MSNIQLFNHEVFGKIRVMLLNDEPIFNLYDVAFSLGYTRPNAKGVIYLRKDKLVGLCNQLGIKAIDERLEKTFNITANIDFGKSYITLDDCVILTRYSCAKNKLVFAQWLEDNFNVIVGSFKIQENYIPIIKESFKQFNPIVEYYIDGYKIDLYIKDLNIGIECDEYHHKEKQNLFKDKERQEYIEKKLGCKFIRFSPNKESFNVGEVINEIITYVLNNIKTN